MTEPETPGLPANWGATADEIAWDWPCADLLPGPSVSLWRAVTVEAPAATTWRWLCQVSVAPYSYDLLDNAGRRSPAELTPGADDIWVGKQMMVFRVTSFETGVHITARALPGPERLFGPFAGTYRVAPVGEGRSRLLCRLDVGRGSNPLGVARRWFLAWGDLVMMRKQLLTLKAHAERQASRDRAEAVDA